MTFFFGDEVWVCFIFVRKSCSLVSGKTLLAVESIGCLISLLCEAWICGKLSRCSEASSVGALVASA